MPLRVSFVNAVGLGLLVSGCASVRPHPKGLLCELSAAPLGVEDSAPTFSWVVDDREQDVVQAAYQIRLCTITADWETVIWDSGRVESSQSIGVPYPGPALEPGRVYYWTVRTWDAAGRRSGYADPQIMVPALGDQWKAQPIWGGADDSFVFLRGIVRLPDKPIHRAMLFVTGRDTVPTRQYTFRMFVNDVPVGLGPARGHSGQLPYNVFDVGHLLRKFQRNALAAVCFSTGENRDFMAELRVFYPDGTMDIFGTDAGWRCLSADPYYNMGPRFSGYYTAGPENIDARQEPVGWRSPIFKDDSWAPVRVLKPYSERLVAQPMRNIEIRGVAPVVGRVKGPGHVFLDFGREIVGSLRLEIDGEDGHPVEVRLGEELSGPMTVRHATRTGVNYVETWTLREGPQLIENFGYRGFRYAELLNLPDTDLMVSAVALAYPFEEDAAAFECSDPGLNRVWALCHYSIQATNLDVYQDCPTRERGPYEGDAYINMLSHYATDREFAFARYSNEYLYHRPTWPTEYKQTCLLMAWADYMATGDAKALAAQYETLCTKTLLDQVNAQGLVEREDTRDNRALVDWPPPYRDGYEFTTVNTVTNSFHCRAVEILADIAGVLGKTEDQARFAAAAERTRAAMTRHLFDADAGVYRDGQNSDHRAAHANFFPLALGLTPPEHRASVADYLIERGMACSVYGAQFLLDALYNAGRGDAALALMTATDTHSWLHMIDDLGATITTEAWDPAGKSNMSFAHPWATAPVNIIPRRLFGIEPLEPGYGRVRIRPQTGGLEWGRLTLPTIRGPIQVAFRDGAKAFKLEVTLPANTSAEVHLPVRAGATSGVVLDGQAVPTVLVDGYRVVERVGAGPRKLVIR